MHKILSKSITDALKIYAMNNYFVFLDTIYSTNLKCHLDVLEYHLDFQRKFDNLFHPIKNDNN